MTDYAITSLEKAMPKPVMKAVRLAYEDANVILEYGCGATTVMAAEMPNKTIFAVDSDFDWTEYMRKYFNRKKPAEGSSVDVSWVNIGPTSEWGHPKTEDRWRQFPAYSLRIWTQEGFQQPDVVLVNGRFRVGCALATAYNTKKPVTLLFDDYRPRAHYHRIEEFLGKPFMTGRMAVFEIEPMPLPVDRLIEIMRMMTKP